MGRFEETIAVVTGGGRGIGSAVARRLAAGGARVFICGRTVDEIESVADSSEWIEAMAVDIRDESQVGKWMETIAESAGRIDLLINNAGVLGPRKSLDETEPDAWRRTIDVNINGTFVVMHEAYALLRAAASPVVINVSSSVGRRGRGLWGAYSVSKFGVEGLAEVAADELADDDGCVVTLNPGGTATKMRSQAYPDEDPATLPDPMDVAETVEVLAAGLTPAQNGAKYSSKMLFDVVGDGPTGEHIPVADG